MTEGEVRGERREEEIQKKYGDSAGMKKMEVCQKYGKIRKIMTFPSHFLPPSSSPLSPLPSYGVLTPLFLSYSHLHPQLVFMCDICEGNAIN